MTPAFLTKLVVRDDGGPPFILARPLVYDSALLDRPLMVPDGFPTDFASIPRPLWSILPPVGKYDAAAVLHDYCYCVSPFGMSRATADRILLEAMQVCQVSALTRRVIYLGVRLGGKPYWDTQRKVITETAA